MFVSDTAFRTIEIDTHILTRQLIKADKVGIETLNNKHFIQT